MSKESKRHRLQLSLTDKEYNRLKQLANNEGHSMATIVKNRYLKYEDNSDEIRILIETIAFGCFAKAEQLYVQVHPDFVNGQVPKEIDGAHIACRFVFALGVIHCSKPALSKELVTRWAFRSQGGSLLDVYYEIESLNNTFKNIENDPKRLAKEFATYANNVKLLFTEAKSAFKTPDKILLTEAIAILDEVLNLIEYCQKENDYKPFEQFYAALNDIHDNYLR